LLRWGDIVLNVGAAISEFLGFYFPIVLGILSQAVFLYFPVALQNWVDDDLYALTYVGFQMLMGALIFIGIPVLLDVFVLGWWRGFVVIMLVMAVASVRAYRMVPLEGSFPTVVPKESVKPIQFLDFNVPLRVRALAELRTTNREEARRLQDLRESLFRKRILMEISSRAEN
jgi:hypothetical protein